MAKVLITGMTSQQVNEKSKRTGITVAGAIAESLRSENHTVDVRPYSFTESQTTATSEYDIVYIGLGPLKGIGTAYMYQAIQCLIDSYAEGKAVLFVDDTATLKIGNEFKTIMRRPQDYVKPFFMYKREWHVVKDMESRIFQQHLDMINILAGNTDLWYPPVLVPSWTFDLAFTAGQRICMPAANHAITFDPSIYFAQNLERHTPERDYWGTFWLPESPPINRMGVMKWEVEQITRHSWHVLSGSSGVLIPKSIWAPEAYLSASLGIPVAADWRDLGPEFGEPWEALPATIEVMSLDQREELAALQRDTIVTERSSKEGVTDILDGIVRTFGRN